MSAVLPNLFLHLYPALIALLTFMKCANNTSFESRDLDEIIVEGTSLYRVIVETTGRVVI
jgi:hypothetical protein